MNNKIKRNLVALLILPYLCTGMVFLYGSFIEKSISAHAPAAIERVKTENNIGKLKELVVAGYETADLANRSMTSFSFYYAIILLGASIISSMAVFNIYTNINNMPSNK